MQRGDRGDGVEAVAARHGDAELVLDGLQEVLRGALPDAHGAVALDVGVAANRAQPRARLADVALQEGDVGDLLDRRHRVAVLGDAHRPAQHRRRGVAEHAGRLLDLRARQPGRGEDGVPVEVAQVRGVLLEAVGVLLDEVVVEGVPRQQQRPDRLEQRQVAVDPDRQVQVGEVGAAPDDAARVLGVLEPDQPGLAQRVDGQDAGAAALGPLQRREHPRVVGAGVLAGHHDQLGGLDVVQADRALADADGLGQADRRRLVAHVGAVGEVVGAERAGQQLVGERRLVGGLAGGVEDRLVGAGEVAQVRADRLEGLLPADRLVVRAAGTQHHRLGQPSLLAQPEVGALGQLRDRVLGEEAPVEPTQRGLLGDGLGAVLAELRGVPVARVRVRPGTALAVEAVDLVELEQRAGGADRTHLLHRTLHGDRHRGRARGVVLGLADVQLALVEVVAGRGAVPSERHAPIMRGRRSRRSTPCGARRGRGCREHACAPRFRTASVADHRRRGGTHVEHTPALPAR